MRAGARGAARAQLGLRRRVAECIPLRLRAGTCVGGGEGRWRLEWGAASLTGRLAARLSRPAHAPAAALWRHAVGSRHWAAAAAEPMRPGGRGGRAPPLHPTFRPAARTVLEPAALLPLRPRRECAHGRAAEGHAERRAMRRRRAVRARRAARQHLRTCTRTCTCDQGRAGGGRGQRRRTSSACACFEGGAIPGAGD